METPISAVGWRQAYTAIECVKCGHKNLTRYLRYRRNFFTRREWLETNCDRCACVLRIPTLDARLKSCPQEPTP